MLPGACQLKQQGRIEVDAQAVAKALVLALAGLCFLRAGNARFSGPSISKS